MDTCFIRWTCWGFAAYVYSLTPEAIKLNKELGVTVSAGMTYGMGFGVGALGMGFSFLISAVVYKVLMVFMSNDTSYKKYWRLLYIQVLFH